MLGPRFSAAPGRLAQVYIHQLTSLANSRMLLRALVLRDINSHVFCVRFARFLEPTVWTFALAV